MDNFQFYMETHIYTEIDRVKSIFNNKITNGGISTPILKLYNRVIVIKTAW